MANNIIYIPPVKDCSYIDIEANLAVCINECFTSKDVFRISNTVSEDELPILNYDYAKKKWLTGRYIGKIYFKHLKQDYCFEVQPRFGNATVMHLLEEIFNVKLANSNSNNTLQNTAHNELIKKLISIIWVKQLSKANLHGLPKHKVKIQYKNSTIKGRINLRKSFLPIYNENLIVSERTEKEIDKTIVSILYKAYQILCKNYYLTQNMLSESVIEIINNSTVLNQNSVTPNQYKSIKYGSMYSNYKDIVDFSWNIIQRKQNNISEEQSKNSGDALFLDMAEIWENYLMSIFKKKYSKDGWKVYSSKYMIYNKQYFKRGLIPDIIIEKEDNVIVFDAKYKNMSSSKNDYDRSDFFQIHTYGSFMKSQNKKVLGLGLLYPLLENMDSEQLHNNFSKNLFGETNNETWFKVDGIKLSKKIEELTIYKNDFLARIEEKLIETI
jgi:5-methylcytosine-specific restriction enzyme subunit McrC